MGDGCGASCSFASALDDLAPVKASPSLALDTRLRAPQISDSDQLDSESF